LVTTADHQLLYTLAKKHGGEMIYPGQLNGLLNTLNKREDIKPVSFTHKKLTELVQLKWIFFLLLSLLGIEWFIRKYYGAY
jgi:hypothetical protein